QLYISALPTRRSSDLTCVLCFQGLWERVCGGDQEWFFHQPEKGESCEKSKIFPGASVELPLYSVGIVRQHIPALFSVKQCHTKKDRKSTRLNSSHVSN